MSDPTTSPVSRGTTGRAIESKGLSIPPVYQGHWAEMAFQASMMGFHVTARSSKSGHNARSRHYVGEAIDVRTAGKTNAEVEDFMSFMESQRYIVRDERKRPRGQAVWSGPHIHVETFDWEGLRDAFSPLRRLE